MANIPKFRKHCIPISLKLIQVSCIPLDIYKNFLYPFKFLANIPVSLKPFQGFKCGISDETTSNRLWATKGFAPPGGILKTMFFKKRII